MSTSSCIFCCQYNKLYWNCIIFQQDPKAEFVRKFLIGFTGGTIASFVNIPFDVAKSRIQGPQPVPGEVKYNGCLRSIGIVYREEGYDIKP